MPYCKRISIILLWLLCSVKLSADKPVAVLTYDSVIVKTQKPSAAVEQQVFSEVDLGFAKTNENKDRGIMDRFLSWLADLIFGNADHNEKRTLVTVFIWLFVIVGLGLAIWIFSRSEFSTFLRGNIKNAEFNFEDIHEDISGIDFNKRIEQAKTESDFRLAIRWLYLKQLFLLNEKNRIAWQPYKTNMDYLNELSKSDLKTAFKDISKVYEYVWYGKYLINQADFVALELQFKKFESLAGV